MSDPDVDLDMLDRAAVRELGGAPAVLVDVLDDWLFQAHGTSSSAHYVQMFLELLAVAGYRVTPIDAPAFEDVMPAAVD